MRKWTYRKVCNLAKLVAEKGFKVSLVWTCGLQHCISWWPHWIIQCVWCTQSTFLLLVLEVMVITNCTNSCATASVPCPICFPSGHLESGLSSHLQSWPELVANCCPNCNCQDRSLLICWWLSLWPLGQSTVWNGTMVPFPTYLGRGRIRGSYFWNMHTLIFTKFSTLWELMVILKTN